MADTEVADEVALTDFDGNEVIYIVDDPSGTPADRKSEIRYWGMPFGMPRRRFYTFNDCILGTAAADAHWGITFSGTGTGVNSISVGTLNAIGILGLGLGTTNAGRAAIGGWPQSSTMPTPFVFGKGAARFQAKAAVHVLSDGTDTFTTRIGFLDGLSADGADGAFFRYTHSVNSGKWECVVQSNSTEGTPADSGVTVVADAWKTFRVNVNAAGTEVTFYIDDALVATVSANIPTASGRETSYGAMAIKTAGTTDTTAVYIDYMEVEYVLTTAR
jgi:hypothetical protein